MENREHGSFACLDVRCLAAVVVVGPVHAQSVVTADVSEVQLSPARDDVKAIGWEHAGGEWEDV